MCYITRSLVSDRLWGPLTSCPVGTGASLGDVKLTTHLHLVPTFRMLGDIPLLSNICSWRGTWLSTEATFTMVPKACRTSLHFKGTQIYNCFVPLEHASTPVAVVSSVSTLWLLRCHLHLVVMHLTEANVILCVTDKGRWLLGPLTALRSMYGRHYTTRHTG
jgi:hypothetical protein